MCSARVCVLLCLLVLLLLASQFAVVSVLLLRVRLTVLGEASRMLCGQDAARVEDGCRSRLLTLRLFVSLLVSLQRVHGVAVLLVWSGVLLGRLGVSLRMDASAGMLGQTRCETTGLGGEMRSMKFALVGKDCFSDLLCSKRTD